MSTKLIMTPEEVIDYAFAPGEYLASGVITDSIIMAAQLRYITPIVGQSLADALADGEYEQLREEYVAPTLGILARIEANLEAYPPTQIEKERGKLFLRTLSEYLESNAESFDEYDPNENVMNRCMLIGGFVL